MRLKANLVIPSSVWPCFTVLLFFPEVTRHFWAHLFKPFTRRLLKGKKLYLYITAISMSLQAKNLGKPANLSPAGYSKSESSIILE